MSSLAELQAQYARLQEAIAVEMTKPNPSPFGLHHASGLILTEMWAHPDYVVPPPTLCVCCNEKALFVLGDWEVCAEHYNSLTEPAPEEQCELW